MAIVGTALTAALLLAFTINALFVVHKNGYFTIFGDTRFVIVYSDSMEPFLSEGSMISCEKPGNGGEIRASSSREAKDGTIIIFRGRNGRGEPVLIAHRVVDVTTDDSGETVFVTRADNADYDDVFRPAFSDIVGIYTGSGSGFWSAFFGFVHSTAGIIVMVFLLSALAAVWIIHIFLQRIREQQERELSALKKSSEALSGVNLRYDNVSEITAVMDVLQMVTSEPKSKTERKEFATRLDSFIRAANLSLPQNAETAALLDNLPAPDTPESLAAALAQGATLRQAEDGQTLIMTTLSGDKHIMLTPVKTADGVILCRQGVRIRSDIAPNIESIGITSIPTAPEFFEGMPLEKNIEYPELPGPGVPLGPQELLSRAPAAGETTDEPAVTEAGLPAPKKAGETETTLRIGAVNHIPSDTLPINAAQPAQPNNEQPAQDNKEKQAPVKPAAKKNPPGKKSATPRTKAQAGAAKKTTTTQKRKTATKKDS